MPYAPIRDLNLYYEIRGDETAEPLFLHSGAFGVIGESSDWSQHFDRFAEHYRLITLEHRGHGRTNNPAGKLSGYSQLATDANALLEYLNIAKAHLVGFSDGGITMLEFARTYPQKVDTLIVIGANYYNDEENIASLSKLTPTYIESNYPGWAATLDKQHGEPGSGYWKILGEQLVAMWQNYPDYTLEQIAEISAPTLVLSGQYDPYGNLNQTIAIHKAIKGSELCIVPGTSHPVMSQRPEITWLIMQDYLGRVKRKRNKSQN